MFDRGGSRRKVSIPTVGIVAVLAIIAGLLIVNFLGDLSNSDGSTENQDPIAQAVLVLGNEYSYDEVKVVTDRALRSANESLTDDNRSRAWSAVLATTDSLAVDPFDVMECVPDVAGSSGMSFPDAAGTCAAAISAGG
tara:strand:- start:710 stop:1123 length:414 start_codon:yes stop_codon:yes gene_type:complete